MAGGIFAFEGDNGKIIWKKENTHSGGLLAMAIHPEGEIFATSGQDGNVQICNCHEGKVIKTLDLGTVSYTHLTLPTKRIV